MATPGSILSCSPLAFARITLVAALACSGCSSGASSGSNGKDSGASDDGSGGSSVLGGAGGGTAAGFAGDGMAEGGAGNGSAGDSGTIGLGGAPPESDGGAPSETPPQMPIGEMPLPACQRTLMVANTAELGSQLPAAKPGDCLILADGAYVFPTITNRASADSPIVVRAQNRGKPTVGSIVFDKAAHVVLEGFTITGVNVKLQDSDYCRISRFAFKVKDAVENDWITMSGSTNHTRIDHNDLGPKPLLGNIVMFAGGENSQVVQYNQIDHNLFHDVKGGGGNGWESIRVGLSGLAASKGFNIIEYNLFKAATGDPETISVKSCDNTVRYNTFHATAGEITLRHGNRSQVYGNFIFADGLATAGGIRVCGSAHRIYNNYVEGVTADSSINLEGGDADGGPGDIPGTAHFRVYDAQVLNNTVVNGRGINIGGGHQFAPKDCVVANNLVQNPSGAGIIPVIGENVKYQGNISSVAGGPNTQVADPKLVKLAGFFRLTAGSPAIDASLGTYDFVSEDIEGQPRTMTDVGADELSTTAVERHPLTEADVGPNAP